MAYGVWRMAYLVISVECHVTDIPLTKSVLQRRSGTCQDAGEMGSEKRQDLDSGTRADWLVLFAPAHIPHERLTLFGALISHLRRQPHSRSPAHMAEIRRRSSGVLTGGR